jgi:hypothetical protein
MDNVFEVNTYQVLIRYSIIGTLFALLACE